MHNSACTAFARYMSFTSNCVEQNVLFLINLTYNSVVGWRGNPINSHWRKVQDRLMGWGGGLGAK